MSHDDQCKLERCKWSNAHTAFDGEKVLEQTVLQPISYDNRISMLHTVRDRGPAGSQTQRTAPLP
jgi:hypothetical protein